MSDREPTSRRQGSLGTIIMLAMLQACSAGGVLAQEPSGGSSQGDGNYGPSGYQRMTPAQPPSQPSQWTRQQPPAAPPAGLPYAAQASPQPAYRQQAQTQQPGNTFNFGRSGERTPFQTMYEEHTKRMQAAPGPNAQHRRQWQNQFINAKMQARHAAMSTSAANAVSQAEAAIAAKNYQAGWNILDQARNQIETMQRQEPGNPMWSVALADLYLYDSYPKPDRAQYYFDCITQACGGPAQAQARLGSTYSRIRNHIAGAREAHRRAPKFRYAAGPNFTPTGIDTRDGYQKARDAGDWDAANRIQSGRPDGSDTFKYGRY